MWNDKWEACASRFLESTYKMYCENETMSKSLSELERTRMQIILCYLDTNKEINSSIAARLLKVEIKTASRLLLKAEKLDILKSYGKTKNKAYFRE